LHGDPIFLDNPFTPSKDPINIYFLSRCSHQPSHCVSISALFPREEKIMELNKFILLLISSSLLPFLAGATFEAPGIADALGPAMSSLSAATTRSPLPPPVVSPPFDPHFHRQFPPHHRLILQHIHPPHCHYYPTMLH